MKAQGTKLEFCVAEIKKIEEHILDLEKKNAESFAFQPDGERRHLENQQHVYELCYQAPLDNADLAAQVVGLHQKLEDQTQTQNMLATRMREMAQHFDALEKNQEPKVEVPSLPVFPSDRRWYEREA